MEVGYKAFRGDLVRGLTLVSDDFRIEPELTVRILRPRPPALRGADLLLRPLVRRRQEDHLEGWAAGCVGTLYFRVVTWRERRDPTG